MITQQLYIRESKRRPFKIHTYQELTVQNMLDIYKPQFKGTNWQQRRLLRYTSLPRGVGQKLNGERVNFQALPTGRPISRGWQQGLSFLFMSKAFALGECGTPQADGNRLRKEEQWHTVNSSFRGEG